MRIKSLSKKTYPEKFVIPKSKTFKTANAMMSDAIPTFKKTIKIELSNLYFNFFFNMYPSKITFTQAEIEVEIANPTCW